jgi:hypothetical protein
MSDPIITLAIASAIIAAVAAALSHLIPDEYDH